MTIVLAIGFCLEAAAIIWLSKIVHRHEIDIFNSEFEIEALQRKINEYKESVDVLSTSVRKLNGVVKDLEQKQPKIEPKNRMNTRVFIAGWDADELEPIQQLISKEELTQQLIKANLNCQRIELLQQQCIYPWQQTSSGAMLPLWYIYRRLEDM